MQFMVPGLLGALSLASVPIIIHVLNRRQFKKVDWAPMKYLKLAIQTSRRRVRLEQLILLAIRTAFVVGLILAVARPVVSEEGALSWVAGRSKTFRLIVVDDSMSMGYRIGEQSSWELATSITDQLVESMPGRDTLTLMVTSTPEAPIVKGIDRAALGRSSGLLGSLGPTDASCSWPRVFSEVERLLVQASQPVQEVTLITDLRREGWSEDVRGFADRLASDGRSLKLVDVGAAATSNLAVIEVAQDSAVAVPGVETEFTAKILNDTGDAYGPFTATVRVGEGSRSLQVPRIAAGAKFDLGFSYTFRAPGTQTLTLELPGDALTADDRRICSVDVREHLDLVLVDGDPGTGPFESETDFLTVAFTIGDIPWRVYVLTDSEWLSEDPPKADLTVLGNVGSLTREHCEKLEELVDRGMGLMIFPGHQIDTMLYNMLLHRGGEGILPGMLGEVLDGHVAGLLIEPEEGSPLRKLGRLAPEALENITAKTVLGVEISEQERQHTRVLARWDDTDQNPAVVHREWGLGEVLLWTLSADREWSDWPVDPTFLLAMREAGMRTCDRGLRALNFEAGQTLALEAGAASVLNPEIRRGGGSAASAEDPGAVSEDGAERLVESLDESERVVLTFDGAHRAGTWIADWTEANGAVVARTLAVNASAAESQLDRADADELRGWLQGLDPVFLHHSELDALIRGPGREIWRGLLIAVLGLFALESGLMVWAGRKG